MNYRPPKLPEDRPIHLVWDHIHKGRPKTFCGAKLRKGHIFVKYWRHADYCETKPRPEVIHVATRGTQNENRTSFVLASTYTEMVCSRCINSEDYVLAMLANLP